MKLIAIFATFAIASIDPGSALAGDKIVLESFTGGKTDDASRTLKPLLGALATRGFVGGDTLRLRFEEHSRPAIAGKLPGDFAKKVQSAHELLFTGSPQDCIKQLTALVQMAQASPGAVIDSEDAHASLEKALVTLGLAELKIGDDKAADLWFAELLRSFPGTQPSRGIYGPDNVKKFEDARKRLQAAGAGKLEVRTSVDSAVIYVNEQISRPGAIAKANLLPGVYRVFAQLGSKQQSRLHVVNVHANETASLAIDIDFDAAVQTSPTWTGLAYADPGQREHHETSHAASFGNALDADAVAVVGIDTVRGQPAVIGILVDRRSGKPIRAAYVSIEPAAANEHLAGLAAFLVGETPTPPEGVRVRDLVTPPPPAPGDGKDRVAAPPIDRPNPPKAGHLWGGWKYITGVVALGALGVGGYYISIDGGCNGKVIPPNPCANLYNTSAQGYAALGGGIAVAAVSLYLFVRKDGGEPSKTAFVAPATGGAIAGLSGRF